MGLLTKVEDRPTPPAVYNWRVYMVATVASFAAMMIGYDSAFIGTTIALPSFTKDFKFASYTTSHLNLVKANIVSCYQAGAFFGSLLGYAVGHFLGRKNGLIFFGAIFTVGAGIMLAASSSVGLGPIYAGRTIAGIAIGGASNLVPIYISEMSPPAIRGRLVGIYELGWQMGGLVGFWINYGLNKHVAPSRKQWLIPFAVQLIPGGLLLLGAVFIVESPRWLYSKGKREQGLKNLCWLRNLPSSDIYIVEEVAAMDSALEQLRSGYGLGFWKPFKAFRDPKIRWRFFLGAMLFLWQNASGINAINYYSPTVFRSLGITGTNTGFLTTGLFGVVKTVLTFVWLFFLIDHFGRRNLLLVGAIGGGISMYIIAALVKTTPARAVGAPLSGKGIAAVFFFYLWTAFYSPSWNGTPWVINSEMFDMQTRPLGQASAAANNWFWNFMISRFTPQMFAAMGYGVYLFFASLMMCSAVFIWFLIPETKGLPLEAMDRLFEIKPTFRAHSKLLVELRAEEEDFRADAKGAGLDAGDSDAKAESLYVEDFKMTNPR